MAEQARELPVLVRSQRNVSKKEDEKEKEKVTVFHMLGKFLYGKRRNIYHDPSNRRKKGNEASAYYTEA